MIVDICNALKRFGQKNIGEQLLRSGTSISANIAEGNHPQSRADMISKFEIALKEANETEGWLKTFYNNNKIDEDTFKNLRNLCGRIRRLLISSIRTLKSKL